MVRIETMLLGQAESNKKHTDLTDDHGIRLTTAETELTKLKTSLNNLRWLGGIILALATIFSASIDRFFN